MRYSVIYLVFLFVFLKIDIPSAQPPATDRICPPVPVTEKPLPKMQRYSIQPETVKIDVGGNIYAFRNLSLIFYPDGRFKGGTLAQDSVAHISCNTLLLPNGSEVSFYPSGKFMSGTLAGCAPVGRMSVTGKTGFFENGLLAAARLCEAAVVDGLTLARDSAVTFFASGRLQGGVLAQETQIGETRFPAGTALSFVETESGKRDRTPAPPGWRLDCATPPVDLLIRGIAYLASFPICFYPSGRVRTGTLAMHTVLDGILYQRGKLIAFDERSGAVRGE